MSRDGIFAAMCYANSDVGLDQNDIVLYPVKIVTCSKLIKVGLNNVVLHTLFIVFNQYCDAVTS